MRTARYCFPPERLKQNVARRRPRARLHWSRAALLLLLLAPLACPPVRGQDGEATEPRSSVNVRRVPFDEIRNKKHVLLLVTKSAVIDVRDPAKVALDDYARALRDHEFKFHGSAFRTIAGRLNKYIRKYRSLSAVTKARDADFIIIFKVMKESGSFIPTQPFARGKMFVVMHGTSEDPRPRIVWESKGELRLAESATDDFIKALRTLRGER